VGEVEIDLGFPRDVRRKIEIDAYLSIQGKLKHGLA
jgi:hypothetical protein